MKDLFSAQAAVYRAFRPVYPQALYDFVLSHCPAERNLVWDVGTGNGQVAASLSPHFEKVVATDLSTKQIEHAIHLPNIEYGVSPAEQSPLSDASADLITVGQALHWFHFERFFEEVSRVLKPDGRLAVWGYDLLTTDVPALNALISRFYKETTGPYWDEARLHIDLHYSGIPFPWPVIAKQIFQIENSWTLDILEGYLNTWSAVNTMMKAGLPNPVPELMLQAEQIMGRGESFELKHPVFVQVF
ncbi:MAG: class I SAM-dependent methyltransferase [Saprospiraceae bacterium]|nr:class I SAM-dependent methyltransferase [Saprospiraceae bacterium]